MFVLALVFYGENKNKSFYWAFFLGLFVDLWFGAWLGRTSLSLLIISFLAYLYTRKYSSSHFIFQAIFSFAAVWIFDLIEGGVWTLYEGLFWALVSVLGLYILKRLMGEKGLTLEV
jgi:rod shape-determining protein MreD